jgi:hypothetical protein
MVSSESTDRGRASTGASLTDQRPKINFCTADVSGVAKNGRFFAPGYIRGNAKNVAV